MPNQSKLKVDFPLGKIYVELDDKGKEIKNSAYIEYNPNFVRKFNGNLNETQVYLDNLVVKNLRPYVSRKTGVQELSIASLEQGTVSINVPYAEYQAYSKRIQKVKKKEISYVNLLLLNLFLNYLKLYLHYPKQYRISDYLLDNKL